MALIKPCPRCQKPLEIPQPPPEQIRCSACGAVIKQKIAHSDKQQIQSAPPPIAPARTAAPSCGRPIAFAVRLWLLKNCGVTPTSRCTHAAASRTIVNLQLKVVLNR